jgi:hypothetical protein
MRHERDDPEGGWEKDARFCWREDGVRVRIFRDGDKILYRWEGRSIKGKDRASRWEYKFTLIRGTGKYEGIKEEATSSGYSTTPMQKAPNQAYEDWSWK